MAEQIRRQEPRAPAPDPAPRWAGAATAPLSDPMLALSGTATEDAPLAAHDVAASLVHIIELERLGLLSQPTAAEATQALQAIGSELADGRFAWKAGHEDVHMNVEAALAARAGEEAAGQLQAGRSRNEEVVTDERLWLLRTAAELDAALAALQDTILARADEELAAGTMLPGHTHLQPAQPVLLSHLLLAWFEMLDRDRGRIADAAQRANRSPAGSGALAGSGLPLDRDRIAAQLGFAGITTNSLDAVADRDYAAELVAACAVAGGHLSRMAGELALWSTPYVGWTTLGDGWVSGSSMLPNKRNPDSCELVRARAARIAADLAVILEVPRGLPLAYHRDLQETRRAMLDAAASLALCLEVMTGVVSTAAFHRHRMRAAAAASSITATALAERLVAAGVPFRAAHHRVGALVARAAESGQALEELPASEVAAALPELSGFDSPVPSLEEAVAAADVAGGTAPDRVAQALAAAQARLAARTTDR